MAPCSLSNALELVTHPRPDQEQAAQDTGPRMVTALEMLQQRQAQPALSTGAPSLGSLLSGELSRGQITELVGTLASGAHVRAPVASAQSEPAAVPRRQDAGLHGSCSRRSRTWTPHAVP